MRRRQERRTIRRGVERVPSRHRHLRGVYLIHDGDPSHTAAATADYLVGCGGWWRSRFTPVHASWLDQAELLLDAFSYHYLEAASWRSPANSSITLATPGRSTTGCMPIHSSGRGRITKMRQWFAEHALNFLHYFVPDPLAREASDFSDSPDANHG